MKISEKWLREWIDTPLSLDVICERLTMAGLEIEEVLPVAGRFSGVVAAHVLRVEKHPEADRLNVCQVDVGAESPLTIVCGANNVEVGIKVPAALDGAVLANKMKIKTSKLRGVVSQGMLCSSEELGLAIESDGLLILPDAISVGEDIWDFFALNDNVIDISITPNRGDCLSVSGIAHELSALTASEINAPDISAVPPLTSDKRTVRIDVPEQCPRYVGRIIRDVTADAPTPIWMQERLRRSGIRCISPVVDVMNYVMLELGQPMHAFDLATLSGGVVVRAARVGEQLELLDGQTLTLDPSVMVIADDKNSLAVAGIMGGLKSAVSLLTKDVFLESAFFTPEKIAQTVRKYKLGSDSSYRFERGVDAELQIRAIERATQLILEIAGGQPGVVVEVISDTHLPKVKSILLRAERMQIMLGIAIPADQVKNILEQLGFACEMSQSDWAVTVPIRRYDVTSEIDLIEEVARIYGYNNIPAHQAIAKMQIQPQPETVLSQSLFARALCDLGYQEVITYSFISKKLHQMFDPDSEPKALVNPMTSEMEVMRTTLWPGLIDACLYNQNRQQPRVKMFETGLRFITQDGNLFQEKRVAGLVSGDVFPKQWGMKARQVDFFDCKGDVEKLLDLTGEADQFEFRATLHPALHPGQSAEVLRDGKSMGVLGALHPSIAKKLNIHGKLFLFELALEALKPARLPHFNEISRFPSIQRDIAIFVDQAIPARSIQDTIKTVAGEWLQHVDVFDVYHGKEQASDRKSLALSLVLQHPSRTLVEEEVSDLVGRVIHALTEKFAAELRG